VVFFDQRILVIMALVMEQCSRLRIDHGGEQIEPRRSTHSRGDHRDVGDEVPRTWKGSRDRMRRRLPSAICPRK
jgi:hypothetical protein